MKTSMALIFWGLLFVILDLYFNGPDVILDVAGYVLVAIGAARLAPVSAHFLRASWCFWLAAATWVILTVLTTQLVPRFPGGEISSWAMRIPDYLYFAALWCILSGIAVWSSDQGKHTLAERARLFRNVFVVVMLLGQLIKIPALAPALIPCFVIGFLALHVLIMVLIYQAWSQLPRGAEDHTDSRASVDEVIVW